MATIAINTDGLKTALAEALADICRDIAIQSAKEQPSKIRQIIELRPTGSTDAFRAYSNERLLIYKLVSLNTLHLLPIEIIKCIPRYHYRPCDFSTDARYEIEGVTYKCVVVSGGNIRLEEELPNER
jgi:hypothetical protein